MGLWSLQKNEWLGNERRDFFAGLVSSVAILPEVIGFSIIAGVPPMSALFASAVTVLMITFTGGRPGMVSAAAGSMALVLGKLVTAHGIEYMLAATILAGVIQLLLGYLGVHKLMAFISPAVMNGFVNALAILIFFSQVQQLPHQSLATYGMVIASLILIYLLPRFVTVVPPALIVIIAMTVVTFLNPGLFPTVGELGEMTAFRPTFQLPTVPLTLSTLGIIFPTALSLALVGLIESLLTLPIIDRMTETTGDSQREAKAQGLANVVTGLFGGQAGCAMIGQAVINVRSGGRTRLSTLVSGLMLLVFIFFLPGVMQTVPLAALIGIMITVSVDTFDWPSLRLITARQWRESLIMLVTVGIIVYTKNLAIGIIIGVILHLVLPAPAKVK